MHNLKIRIEKFHVRAQHNTADRLSHFVAIVTDTDNCDIEIFRSVSHDTAAAARADASEYIADLRSREPR